MRLIYLAGPIDGVDGPEMAARAELRQQVRAALMARDMTVFDPAGAGMSPLESLHASDYRIYQICHRVVTLVDGVVFVAGRSTGSGMEIEKACALAIPVVAFVPRPEDYTSMLNRPGVYRIGDVDGTAELMDMLSQRFQTQEHERAVQRMLVAGFGELPSQTYPNDAGFDLAASEDIKIASGGTELVPFDISVQMPPGYWAWITGRSSMIRKRNLLVTSGIIDHGYRGELFANVTNMNGEDIVIKKGERVAQLIPMGNHAPTMRPVRVNQLDPGDRGEHGFGSSGQ